MTIGADELPIIFDEERPPTQGHVACDALQARVVPVVVIVKNILVIHGDLLVASVAGIGTLVVVAADADGLVGLYQVLLPTQLGVANPAAEVVHVKVLFRGFHVFSE